MKISAPDVFVAGAAIFFVAYGIVDREYLYVGLLSAILGVSVRLKQRRRNASKNLRIVAEQQEPGS